MLSPPSSPTPDFRPVARALRVMVVDDAPDNAEMLAALVAAHGCHVRIAECGADALKLLEEEGADLVFLDVGLPDMDGYEVAMAIRARFHAPCRIVALTGFSGEEERKAAARAGCDAFVEKPFPVEQIQKWLDMSSPVPSI